MQSGKENVEGLGRFPWVDLPENQAAWQAVQGVWHGIQPNVFLRRHNPLANPLFLHGPTGSGKSYLLDFLTSQISRHGLDLRIAPLAARDFLALEEGPPPWQDADLILVEDLQHLPDRAIETMVTLTDRCLSRRRPLLVTATEGPGRLTRLPLRLTSRLAQGLVVALHPLSPDSRRLYLTQRSEALALSLSTEIIDWLSLNTPGSIRQLEGALRRIVTLSRISGPVVSVADIEAAFHEDSSRRLTLEQIAALVGRYFHVDPRAICSRRRSQEVLLPRQVGMYLARQLTSLSLEQIGAYFGGRDHSTVLHACRKVAEALPGDARLSGAVTRLQADLG